MTASPDIEAALRGFLKSYDRIGFGRRGVLDAEGEIRRFAAALPEQARPSARRIILSWIESAEAERVAAPLHYNLPEHVQALAIRLCAGLPIPESLPLLQRLQAEGAFAAQAAEPCRTALREALTLLQAAGRSGA